MFENIGSKMKKSSEILIWVGIAFFVMIGIIYVFSDLIFAAIIVPILGSIFSWVASLALYGLGQIVENSELQKKYLCEMSEKINEISKNQDIYNKKSTFNSQKNELSEGQ